MQAPEGYVLQKSVIASPRIAVALALRERDGAEVVLKGYPERGHFAAPERAQREHDLLCSLPPGVAARPLAVERTEDHRVLVLERHFSWLGGLMSRIVRLDAAALDTAMLAGEEIARLAPPLLAENFEAIAVAPASEGGLHVALLSDDNYSPLQRTLLLLFRLER